MKLPETPPAKAMKRPAPDDEDTLEQQPAKRLKTDTNRKEIELSSPRKKRQLEEDGLIILDGPEEGDDDAGVIIID